MKRFITIAYIKSIIGIISNFVSSLSANFRTKEMVGKVGTYCAAHSGPRAASFSYWKDIFLSLHTGLKFCVSSWLWEGVFAFNYENSVKQLIELFCFFSVIKFVKKSNFVRVSNLFQMFSNFKNWKCTPQILMNFIFECKKFCKCKFRRFYFR